MEANKNDNQYWDVLKKYYEEKFTDRNKRIENELEAYWCRPAGNNQELFQDPMQRIFARFLRSYLNTTWHKISLTYEQRESLFSDTDIIQKAVPKIESIIKVKSMASEKSDHSGLQKLLQYCVRIVEFIDKLNFEVYEFHEEQAENFKILSAAIKDVFIRENNLKVSKYERLIYENLDEPYQTIMKMQKLFPGFGIALTCDFLKESHLCNIAKPDVHISHVFSVIDGIPYSMDLALVKRVAEFAQNACPPGEKNFCNTGSYNIDKIIWSTCSNYMTEADRTKSKLKGSFLKQLTGTML